MVPPLGSLASLLHWVPATAAMVMVDTMDDGYEAVTEQDQRPASVQNVASQEAPDCAGTEAIMISIGSYT